MRVCDEEEDALEVSRGLLGRLLFVSGRISIWGGMLFVCVAYRRRCCCVVGRFWSASRGTRLLRLGGRLRPSRWLVGSIAAGLFSTRSGSWPRSAAVMFRRGRPVNSATDSGLWSDQDSCSRWMECVPAVSVLPVPGDPCRRMIWPSPFP